MYLNKYIMYIFIHLCELQLSGKAVLQFPPKASLKSLGERHGTMLRVLEWDAGEKTSHKDRAASYLWETVRGTMSPYEKREGDYGRLNDSETL